MSKQKKILSAVLAVSMMNSALCSVINADTDQDIQDAPLFTASANESKEADTSSDTSDFLYGDLNGDGIADLTDLTSLSLYLMKSMDFSDDQVEAADIDANGDVDIADLAYYKQYVCKDKSVEGKLRINCAKYVFTAYVKEVYEKEILTSPSKGTMEAKSCDLIIVNYDPEKVSVKPGDMVLINYNGFIMESYPAQIYSYSVKVINEEIQDDKNDVSDSEQLITMHNIIDLARKGNDLKPINFSKFKHTDIGSGLYVYQYDMADDRYQFKLSFADEFGSDIISAELKDLETGESVDIRSDEADEFFIKYLKAEYPEYFGISDFKGIEVYEWQMAGSMYCFTVMEGTNRNKTEEEIFECKALSLNEAKLVLKELGTPPENIFVIPVVNPISSYAYNIDKEYQKKIEAMIKGDKKDKEDSVKKFSVSVTSEFDTGLEKEYAAGEKITFKLPTATDSYYAVKINGEELSLDVSASDMEFTYFTFVMPEEDIKVEVKSVDASMSPK